MPLKTCRQILVVMAVTDVGWRSSCACSEGAVHWKHLLDWFDEYKNSSCFIVLKQLSWEVKLQHASVCSLKFEVLNLKTFFFILAKTSKLWNATKWKNSHKQNLTKTVCFLAITCRHLHLIVVSFDVMIWNPSVKQLTDTVTDNDDVSC